MVLALTKNSSIQFTIFFHKKIFKATVSSKHLSQCVLSAPLAAAFSSRVIQTIHCRDKEED